MAACQVQAPAKLASQSQDARFHRTLGQHNLLVCKSIIVSGFNQLKKLSRPLLLDRCTLDFTCASI